MGGSFIFFLFFFLFSDNGTFPTTSTRSTLITYGVSTKIQYHKVREFRGKYIPFQTSEINKKTKHKSLTRRVGLYYVLRGKRGMVYYGLAFVFEIDCYWIYLFLFFLSNGFFNVFWFVEKQKGISKVWYVKCNLFTIEIILQENIGNVLLKKKNIIIIQIDKWLYRSMKLHIFQS